MVLVSMSVDSDNFLSAQWLGHRDYLLQLEHPGPRCQDCLLDRAMAFNRDKVVHDISIAIFTTHRTPRVHQYPPAILWREVQNKKRVNR